MERYINGNGLVIKVIISSKWFIYKWLMIYIEFKGE